MPEQTNGQRADASGGIPARWRVVAFVAVVVGLVVLARILGAESYLVAVRDWIDGLGKLGPVAFVGIYIVAVVAAVPGSALTIAAGVLFGSVVGTILVSVGSTVGASLSFLIARYLARGATANWLSGSERFRRLDRMTERHGAVIVALTRLVPLFPFNLLNYGFGLTRVRFGTYVFWSWLCMLPATVIYVVGGDALIRGIAEGRVPWLPIGTLLLVGFALVFVVRGIRGRLSVDESGPNED